MTARPSVLRGRLLTVEWMCSEFGDNDNILRILITNRICDVVVTSLLIRELSAYTTTHSFNQEEGGSSRVKWITVLSEDLT